MHNRRKSRAGSAFEHHIEAIFRANDLRFSRGKVTEPPSKPDFIFPSIDDYRDTAFPHDRLTMLAVKSTCKDRWRQILAEATRIPRKHLATLEPGISQNQTAEMKGHGVQLVVPVLLHSSFLSDQTTALMNLAEFLDLVRLRERH